MSDSPAVIPFSSTGIAMPVEDDVSIPAGTSGLLIAGKDEIDVARFLNVDGYGSPIIVGTGPSNSVPISGTVTGTITSGSLSGTVTSNQGLQANHANRWPVGINDGSDFAGVVAATPDDNALGIVVRTAGSTDVTIARASNATRTNITSSVSEQLLLAANSLRLGVVFYNDSDSSLYIGFGTTVVTSTNFSILIAASTEYFVPINFVGQIRGLWQSASGFLRVSELLL